ncbi:MAG: DUF1853 family protein, partial [Flavobacteriales bacterium]|nr:DUF1853 family protein [Flavobacteriales bacterium]
EPLLKWFESNKHRDIPSQEKHLPLGKYAETLLLFYLENHDHFQLLSHSLQLNQEKITIGELDYLFSKEGDEHAIHLELAIKFYLKVERDGTEVYLGPSTKDWMKRKLVKLFSHQLQLPHQRKDLLPSSLQKLDFTSQLYLKGTLFLPYNEWEMERQNPLNCGWWIIIEELDLILNKKYHYSVITKKADWIFPFNSRHPLYQKDEFSLQSNQMLEGRDEIMLCRFDENKKVLDRGFVMRANWPQEQL